MENKIYEITKNNFNIKIKELFVEKETEKQIKARWCNTISTYKKSELDTLNLKNERIFISKDKKTIKKLLKTIKKTINDDVKEIENYLNEQV